MLNLNETAATTITDSQIEALRVEAGAAGDLEMVDVCTDALGGDGGARAECAQVIVSAEGRD